VVDLSSLLATGPDGRKRRIVDGSYLVTSVSKTGVVHFRAEIPSDFPCGEPVTDPVRLPPTFRAGAAEFFNAGNRALLGKIHEGLLKTAG
jgi:hypothetical protein